MEPDLNPWSGRRGVRDSRSVIAPWLMLLRPPNFLTVPGDVLAGYFLTAGAAGAVNIPGLLAVTLAALFFYGSGLLLNDWADAEIDRVERPERPVPAKLVSRRAVLFAALITLAIATTLCLWQGDAVSLAGLALALAIGSYNLLTKNLPLLGPLNMGLCRGLSFLLGATLAAGFTLPTLAWWGVAALAFFIAAVTHLAQREMTGRYWLVERWLPTLVLVTAFFVYLPLSELVDWPAQVAVALLFLIAAAGAGRVAGILPNRDGLAPASRLPPPVPTPALIGRLIAILLPLQSAFIVGSRDGLLPFVLGIIVIALWPVKIWLGRRFYSS